MVKIKKKRYGIGKLSKEEGMRITMRTEERLILAKAKANLWRRARDPGGASLDNEEDAWKTIVSS